MQGFARGSFFSGFLGGTRRTFLVRVGCRASCEAMREALHSNAITEPRAELSSLYNEQLIIAGQWATYCLNLAHTIGTEGIEPHTVLFFHQMFDELCLQQDKVFSTQKTFEERVLCPLSKTQKDFMDFRAPFIIRNIVGNHVTGN